MVRLTPSGSNTRVDDAMTMTAARCVNSIDAVLHADAGYQTFLDLRHIGAKQLSLPSRRVHRESCTAKSEPTVRRNPNGLKNVQVWRWPTTHVNGAEETVRDDVCNKGFANDGKVGHRPRMVWRATGLASARLPHAQG